MHTTMHPRMRRHENHPGVARPPTAIVLLAAITLGVVGLVMALTLIVTASPGVLLPLGVAFGAGLLATAVATALDRRRQASRRRVVPLGPSSQEAP